MIIKKFKIFESNNLESKFPSLDEVRSYFYDFESKFPSLDEVKSYFYDFTDNIGNINRFDVGYVYFESARYSRIMKTSERPDEDFVDISNTTLTNNQLGIINDFVIVNKEIPDNKKNKLKYILSGDIPSYEYMSITFFDNLFDENNLEVLIHCLKVLYSETGFRPFGCLWTEDYVSDDGDDVITKLGFEGTFFRGSDEEYLKFCKIFDQGNRTKDLVKFFV
jgi:hypothetical protein